MSDHALAMFDQQADTSDENKTTGESLSTEIVESTALESAKEDLANQIISEVVDGAISIVKRKNEQGEIKRLFQSKLQEVNLSFL